MVTLKEQVDIKAPYERIEAWANNFQGEFVRWSPYHTECEMYDGGYQKGMKVLCRMAKATKELSLWPSYC